MSPLATPCSRSHSSAWNGMNWLPRSLTAREVAPNGYVWRAKSDRQKAPMASTAEAVAAENSVSHQWRCEIGRSGAFLGQDLLESMVAGVDIQSSRECWGPPLPYPSRPDRDAFGTHGRTARADKISGYDAARSGSTLPRSSNQVRKSLMPSSRVCSGRHPSRSVARVLRL